MNNFVIKESGVEVYLVLVTPFKSEFVFDKEKAKRFEYSKAIEVKIIAEEIENKSYEIIQL